VGIVALPLSIAFAIASGVSPEQGIFTAIIAGFLISALSGSRVQIGGPTGAFIVVVAGVVAQYGYAGLATATLLAGVLLIIMGLARFGVMIKYIPYPVTIGFTSGIALIIFTTQLRDFLGLAIESVPAPFLAKCVVYAKNIHGLNAHAIGIGLLSLIVILAWPRLTHRIPGSIVAILLATMLVQMFNLPVETIGSRFGDVPTSLRIPVLPSLNWELVREVFPSALTIAVLAAIESLLSAVVADGMTGERHSSNMELIAQGVANIASPLFGGIPATGAIARTATNIKNRGTNPIAGMTHAIVLLLIMLFFGKWARLIPMATLSAILMIVAYNMSEWRLFVRLLRSPSSDVAVLLTTFLLTVLIDLTVAIEVGIVLAALLFMRRMAAVSEINLITNDTQRINGEGDAFSLRTRRVPKGVEIFEIEGPFFFGAADRFKSAMRVTEDAPRVLILRMRHVPAVDATGLRALEDMFEKSKHDGTTLILSGVHTQPRAALLKFGLLDRIGPKQVCDDIDEALARATALVEPSGTSR